MKYDNSGLHVYGVRKKVLWNQIILSYKLGAATILLPEEKDRKGEILMTELVWEGLMRTPGWPGFYS